jgi:hypothetical protein
MSANFCTVYRSLSFPTVFIICVCNCHVHCRHCHFGSLKCPGWCTLQCIVNVMQCCYKNDITMFSSGCCFRYKCKSLSGSWWLYNIKYFCMRNEFIEENFLAKSHFCSTVIQYSCPLNLVFFTVPIQNLKGCNLIYATCHHKVKSYENIYAWNLVKLLKLCFHNGYPPLLVFCSLYRPKDWYCSIIHLTHLSVHIYACVYKCYNHVSFGENCNRSGMGGVGLAALYDIPALRSVLRRQKLCWVCLCIKQT